MRGASKKRAILGSLQDEIALTQRRDVRQCDLKIGIAVAVDVALDHAVGEAKLAGDRMEVGSSDIIEALVAVGHTVGIDRGKHDSIMLAVMEIPGCLVALYLVSTLRKKRIS